MKKDDRRERAKMLITEIDPAELTVRLVEIGCHMKRPPGMSGQEALRELRQSHIAAIAIFSKSAIAAIAYFGQRIAALQTIPAKQPPVSVKDATDA